MMITIEFYRTRDADDAHAVLARVNRDVTDETAAPRVARMLVRTIDLPQEPDEMVVCDAAGRALYRGPVMLAE
jgi:hypothetical protein